MQRISSFFISILKKPFIFQRQLSSCRCSFHSLFYMINSILKYDCWIAEEGRKRVGLKGVACEVMTVCFYLFMTLALSLCNLFTALRVIAVLVVAGGSNASWISPNLWRMRKVAPEYYKAYSTLPHTGYWSLNMTGSMNVHTMHYMMSVLVSHRIRPLLTAAQSQNPWPFYDFEVFYGCNRRERYRW